MTRIARVVVLAYLLAGLVACAGESAQVPSGEPRAGWQALQDYGCESCHTIPGVPGHRAYVGPPLTAWAERAFIAGTLPNNPENLVRWITETQEIAPGSAMPDLDVSQADALNMAAYLFTLED